MRNLLLSAVATFATLSFSLTSLAAFKVQEISDPTSPLLQKVEEEIAVFFDLDELEMTGVLVCKDGIRKGMVICNYELGIQRCKDGERIGRWIRVVADLTQKPIALVSHPTIYGGCETGDNVVVF